MDWLDDQIKIWLGPIVAASAQVDALRNAAIGTDINIRQIVDPHVFANPAVVADLEPPRKLDAHSRFDVDAVPDLRAKQSQYCAAMRCSREKRTHKTPLREQPDGFDPFRASPVERSAVVGVELHNRRQRSQIVRTVDGRSPLFTSQSYTASISRAT